MKASEKSNFSASKVCAGSGYNRKLKPFASNTAFAQQYMDIIINSSL
jgi:hypothetical protein